VDGDAPSGLLRDTIYARLRGEILTCRLLPGEELREGELAARLNVSKQPVREALLRLERERLVTVLPRQGYRVNPVSLSDARDIFRLREVLEPACAADVARAASADALGGLDRFKRFEGSPDAFIEANREFHCGLARLSPYPRMAAAICDLVEQADRLTLVSLQAVRGRDPARLVAEHVAIVEAVQERNGRLAARLLRDHVAEAQERVVAALSRHAIVA